MDKAKKEPKPWMSLAVFLDEKERWAFQWRAKLLKKTYKDYIRWLIINDLEQSGFLKLAETRFKQLSEGKTDKAFEEEVKNILFKSWIEQLLS